MRKHTNKILIILAGLVFFISDAFAQFEISPYTGYMFGGRGYGYYIDVNISDGQNFGIIGDIPVYPGVQAELMYNRMVSRASVWDYREKETEVFDIASEYFMIGALKDVDYGKVKPFGIFLLGIAAHTPQRTQYNNKISFAMTLGGGVKIFPTEFLGIRLQGRLLAPLYLSGIGLGCGIGTGGAGCGGGVGMSSTLLQGDFSAGIILILKGRQASGTSTY
jgi:hypothetical protein